MLITNELKTDVNANSLSELLPPQEQGVYFRNFFDAFISYGRADSKTFAMKLYDCLTKLGYQVWFDQNDIPLGMDFQEQINDGLAQSHNFLFIISPHSINSPYCAKELELAAKYKKRIIPILHVEEISQETWQQRNPNKTINDWEIYQAKGLHSIFQNMPPTIGKINWVYSREGDNGDDFEVAIEGLENIFERDWEYVYEHTYFLDKALIWKREHKQTQYLLTGPERLQGERWLRVKFKEDNYPCEPSPIHCEFICESDKNAKNSMSQVFLCYAESDKEIMAKIREMLMRQAFTVWTNKTDVQTGTEFEEEIRQGIEKSDNLVYLLSSHAIASKYCQLEFDHGLANNKRIIPILIESIDLQQVPKNLLDLQFIDFVEYQNNQKCQDSIDKLISTLNRDFAYYEKHKILLTKSLKWQRQKQNHSLLLRGHDLNQAQAWFKEAKQRSQHQPTPLQTEFINASIHQPPMESVDVFISYSRTDSDFARKLNDALQQLGKTTWFDQESIASGTDFQQEIYRGIESADNFLLILSPQSVNSPYCSGEVSYAHKLNKRFISLLYRPISSGSLPPSLGKIQWIDFNTNKDDFSANFNELIRTLDTDRDHVKAHTKWGHRAREWELKHNSADWLLRGSEFSLAQQWLRTAKKENKQPSPTQLQENFINQSAKEIKKQQWIKKGVKLGVMSLCLIIAFLGVLAIKHEEKTKQFLEQQINALSRASDALRLAHQEFDALLFAIRAAQPLQQKQLSEKPATNHQVKITLQKALLEVKELNRFSGHTGAVFDISFSPNGQYIATASGDGTVKLWDTQGQELSTFVGHEHLIWSLSFSQDSQTIATGSQDKTVKLWNLQGEELLTLKGHKQPVTHVTFSQDGQTLASASEDGTVKLWSIQGEELQTLEGHQTGVWSVSFSPDGQTLATVSVDGNVSLWSIEGEKLISWKGDKKWLWSVSFSPDGQTLATGGQGKTVKLWDLQGKEIKTFKGHKDTVTHISFSPDGKTLATGSTDKNVKLWNVVDGKEIQTIRGHDNWIWSVNFSPDGQTLATASKDATVKLWNLNHKSGKTRFTKIPQHDAVTELSFSPDGKLLATVHKDKTAKIWTRDGKLLHNLEEHTDEVWDVSFSPDGQILATASTDRTVKLWDLQGKLIKTFAGQKGHKDAIWRVRFSPDGKTIATASSDKTAKLWNLKGKVIQTFEGHNAKVHGVNFSPDGKMLATSSSNGTVKLWSREGKELLTLRGHQNSVFTVSFSPDGQKLATASSDKTVKIWSIKGKELTTLTGHTDSVFSVSFSPDGEILATMSRDGTTKIWNLEGMLLETFTGHKGSVLGASFTSDGNTLATGSSDKSVILWHLDREKLQLVSQRDLDYLMNQACDWVEDYLKYNKAVNKNDRKLCQ